MGGEEMYRWFETELKTREPELAKKVEFNLEPTVTPGVLLAKISKPGAPRPLVKSDVRPEGIRMHFPVPWQADLSDWLGQPPPDQYRLKSNWVNQPSIGVGTEAFDPYFKQLGLKVIELLKKEVS